MIYAKNDIELKEKLHPVDRPTKEDRIIMYTTLEELVDYVIKIKEKKEFKLELPLLYVNSGWHYGKIDESSILMGSTKKEFIDEIKKKYNSQSWHSFVEIICQIPLSNDIFKFFYVSDQSGGYKEKYLKYKNKYLKLKQQYSSKI